MKTLTLVLALIFSFVCLAAVESDDSNIIGFAKVRCYTNTTGGLNLIALPLEQGYTMISELGDDYPGMFDAVSYWDPYNQSWVSALDLGYWDGDFAFDPSTVLFVNAMNNFTIYNLGSVPQSGGSRHTIVQGLNTIAITLWRYYDDGPGATSASALDARMTYWYNGTDSVNDAISYWDSDSDSWVSALNFGSGYWDGDFDTFVIDPFDPDFPYDPRTPGCVMVNSTVGSYEYPWQ